MEEKDIMVRVNIALIALALFVTFIALGFTRNDVNKQKERIDTLEAQVLELQVENQFLKDHYEEEIVMLDSQLLVLEGEIVEMKDGVELIKK